MPTQDQLEIIGPDGEIRFLVFDPKPKILVIQHKLWYNWIDLSSSGSNSVGTGTSTFARFGGRTRFSGSCCLVQDTTDHLDRFQASQ